MHSGPTAVEQGNKHHVPIASPILRFDDHQSGSPATPKDARVKPTGVDQRAADDLCISVRLEAAQWNRGERPALDRRTIAVEREAKLGMSSTRPRSRDTESDSNNIHPYPLNLRGCKMVATSGIGVVLVQRTETCVKDCFPFASLCFFCCIHSSPWNRREHSDIKRRVRGDLQTAAVQGSGPHRNPLGVTTQSWHLSGHYFASGLSRMDAANSLL